MIVGGMERSGLKSFNHWRRTGSRCEPIRYINYVGNAHDHSSHLPLCQALEINE